jgi:hypothetical protein
MILRLTGPPFAKSAKDGAPALMVVAPLVALEAHPIGLQGPYNLRSLLLSGLSTLLAPIR